MKTVSSKLSRRTGLFIYLFILIIGAISIMIFEWIPNPTNISVKETSVPTSEGNKTVETRTSTNTTTNESTSTTVLSLPNGTDRFISSVKHILQLITP